MSETGPTAFPGAPESAIADPELDEAAYGTKVEEAFIAERGTPFLLSPKDWALIRSWREGGVPVDTVIRAVRETFERRRTRGQAGKISSIAYCENAVEERWEMERRGLVGKGEGLRDVPPAEAGERLDRLAAALMEAAERAPAGIDAAAFQKKALSAAEAVRALPRAAGVDELEAALGKIESSLLRSLERRLEETARASVDAVAAETLGDPHRLSLEARDRMRRALVRREVRRRLSLPALTLFDGW